MSQTNVKIDAHLYKVSQILIEIWDTLNKAMIEQNIDIIELSHQTGLEERELESYLQGYADAKITVIIKVASILGKTIDIKVEDTKNTH